MLIIADLFLVFNYPAYNLGRFTILYPEYNLHSFLKNCPLRNFALWAII
jgi:hypothetical protein